MGKTKNSAELGNITDNDSFRRFASIIIAEMAGIINGNINLDENCNVNILDMSFTSADTNLTVSHGLGRTPSYYFLVKTSAAAVVYTGSTAWSKTSITLKSNVVADTKVLIF